MCVSYKGEKQTKDLKNNNFETNKNETHFPPKMAWLTWPSTFAFVQRNEWRLSLQKATIVRYANSVDLNEGKNR